MQPIARAVPGALAQLLRDAPLSPGKVQFAWKAAVGTALDRVTTVRLEGDVLLVVTENAQWTREVARSTPMILSRLQQCLGAGVISRLDVRSRL